MLSRWALCLLLFLDPLRECSLPSLQCEIRPLLVAQTAKYFRRDVERFRREASLVNVLLDVEAVTARKRYGRALIRLEQALAALGVTRSTGNDRPTDG